MAEPWVIAGLGNPGDEYRRTRHNAGAMVVEELASRAGARFRRVRFLPLEVAEIREAATPVYLARSLRYMNEAGPSYASLARRHGVPAGRVVAVHDDIDLPFGAIRMKVGGSTAGHNGLKSLQAALRSPDFPRVRIGVGRPPGRQDPADYVLRAFTAREREHVPLLVADAAEAVRAIVTEGLEAARQRHSRSGPDR